MYKERKIEEAEEVEEEERWHYVNLWAMASLYSRSCFHLRTKTVMVEKTKATVKTDSKIISLCRSCWYRFSSWQATVDISLSPSSVAFRRHTLICFLPLTQKSSPCN